MLDPAAFKAYDVRALYPEQLDEAGAYAIGRAFVEQFEPRRIAVGHDMRLSSPSMAAAVIDGAADGGADVVDLGLVGTEMVYFATDALSLDGGVMVTASHNPKQYTGMKIVRRGALPVGSESGLFEIRDRALRAEWRETARGEVSQRGRLGSVRRAGDRLRRRRRDRARAGRRRRRERDGGRDGAARARPSPPGRRRALLLRAGRHLPQPRAEPAPPGEPRVHRREDARRGRGVRGRLRRRRRPLLLRRRHAASSSPATS